MSTFKVVPIAERDRARIYELAVQLNITISEPVDMRTWALPLLELLFKRIKTLEDTVKLLRKTVPERTR